MNKPIDRTKDNKILAAILLAAVIVFVITIALLTKEKSELIIEEDIVEQQVAEVRSSEEERQLQELQKEMENFKSLTEEEIAAQTRELEDLFQNIR